jgi:hypothetical protein
VAPPPGARAHRRWPVAVVLLLAAAQARASDFFEIQVFHTTINAPRQLSFELHSNYVPVGARAPAPPLLPTDGVLYENLEPVIGVARNWEVGVHLLGVVRPGWRAEWGGVRLRTLLKLPRRPGPFSLAVNLEAGYSPAGYDPARWSCEVRPIVEWHPGNWDIDFNPVLGFGLTGAHAGVPSFEPAAQVRYEFERAFTLGLEYYGATGPLDAVEPVDRQGHYLFETVDFIRWPKWIVHFGVGQGLTPGASPLVVTTIVGRRL